MTEKYIERLC